MAEQHLAFAAGLDEGTRAELVDPAQGVLRLENAAQDKRGAISKRRGFAARSTDKTGGGSVSEGKLLIDSDRLLTSTHYMTFSATRDAWSERSRCSEVMTERYGVSSPDSSPRRVAAAYAGGYIITASVTYDGAIMYLTVHDGATYHEVQTTRTACHDSAYWAPKLVVTGDTVHVVYPTSATDLVVRTLDVTDPDSGWSSPASVSNAWTNRGFDAVGYDATRWYVAWTTSGASEAAAAAYDETGTIVGSGASIFTTVDRDIAIAVDASNLWFVSCDNGTSSVYLMAVSRTSLLTVTATIATVASGLNSPQSCAISDGWLTFTNIDESTEFGTYSISGGGAAVYTFGHTANYVTALSFPFTVAGAVYCWLIDTESVDNTAVLVHLTGSFTYPLRPVALTAARLCTSWTNQNSHASSMRPCRVGTVSATETALGIIVRRRAEITDDSGAAAEVVRTSWGGAGTAPATRDALPGGVAQFVDQRIVAEIGFPYRPRIVSRTNTGVGNLSASSGYRYVAVYEWTDSDGRTHQSAPSDPSASTGALTTRTIQVAIAPCYVTGKHSALNRDSKVRVVVYRSGDGDAIYQRLGSTDNNTLGPTVLLDDDGLVTPVAYLYGTGMLPDAGGALPRQSPPCLRAICQHGLRIVGVSDDGASLWYSGDRVYGEGVWFSDAQQLFVPAAGRLVTCWSQDGRLVAASRDELYIIDGDGPGDDGGSGQEFSPARRLPTDVGCIERRSVVTCEAGTFFQSRRGIELLNRGFGVEWIGEPVADTLAAFPTVTSAALDTVNGRVYLTVTDGTNGRALVFDTQTKTWSVDRRYGTAADQPAVSAAYTDGRMHWLASDGTVYREGTDHLDAGQWVTMAVETAWMKLAGLGGYARVRRVQVQQARTTAYDMAISSGYDDQAAFVQPRTYTHAALSALTTPFAEYVPERAQTKTFRVRITDATPSSGSVGSGAGPVWYGLSVEFDGVGGLNRRPDGAR
jgi:hypothetical protein